MSVDTIAAAKAALYALLQTGGTPTISGVTVVYDHEPTKINGPVAITISTDGLDPNWWRLALRIYVQVSHDAQEGSNTMDTVLLAVDHKASHGPFGPSEWSVDTTETREYLVATSILEVGREDQPPY